MDKTIYMDVVAAHTLYKYHKTGYTWRLYADGILIRFGRQVFSTPDKARAHGLRCMKTSLNYAQVNNFTEDTPFNAR